MGFYFGLPFACVKGGVHLGEDGHGAVRADTSLLQIGHRDPEPVADRFALLVVLVDMVLEVVITDPAGAIYFRGIVGKTPRRKSGTSEFVKYEIWGPWYWLERLPFQQEWRSTNGIVSVLVTTTKSRIIVGQNIDGTKMDLGMMMKTVLAYVLAAAAVYVDPRSGLPAPFVPFQIGDVTPSTTIPFIEIKDMACAQLIKAMAKFVPSTVERVDYTTTPPTLHFTQRATMTSVAIPIKTAGTKVTSWDIDSREDLQISAVIAKYEETNVIDGVSLDTVTVKKFPLDAPDNGFHSLVTTVDLVGGHTAYQKQPVTVTDRPRTPIDGGAMAWIARHNSWMREINTGGAGFYGGGSGSSFVYDFDGLYVVSLVTNVDPADPNAYYTDSGAVNPNRDPAFPASGVSVDNDPDKIGAMARELVKGEIAPWMKDSDGVFSVKAKLAAVIGYAPSGSATPGQIAATRAMLDADGYFHFTTDFVATNAANQTYEELTDAQAGEPVPVGLEQALYNELSVLQYDGFVETTETRPSGWIGLGNVFNTTDGRTEWRTMNATVVSIVEQVDSGVTRVRFGPARLLNLQEYVEMLRALRGIEPSYRLDSRTDAKTPGVQVQGSAHAPAASTMGKPSSNPPKPWAVILKNIGMSGSPHWQASVSPGVIMKSQTRSDTLDVSGLDTPVDIDPTGDFFYVEVPVASYVAGTGDILNKASGSFDPTKPAWDSGAKGYLANDGATPPAQTFFRVLLATIATPSGASAPVVTPCCSSNLLMFSDFILGEPCIIAYPAPTAAVA